MSVLEVTIPLDVYSLESIKFASYTFFDQGYVKIEKKDNHNAIVKIETDKNPEILEKLFFNELLHQSLRIEISKQNSRIRERLVLQALVSAVRSNTDSSSNQQNQSLDKGQQSDISKEIADMALEEEINKLLKEAEEGSYKEDPLSIAIPWEEKNK